MRTRQNKQLNPPDLSDVLESLSESISKGLNCIKVGEIQGFNTERQTATIQLSIKQIVDVDPAGVKRLQDYPVLAEVPVVFLGGGSSHLTIPPKSGDSCVVMFNDRDIDLWFTSGAGKAPQTYRRHDLSDGIALVGIRNLTNLIGDFLESGVRLQYDSANKMELKDGTIETTTPLLKQTGSAEVTGGLAIGGTVTQLSGSPLSVNADVTQTSGKVLKAGNGDSGSFTTNDGKTVTVQDGIVVSIV